MKSSITCRVSPNIIRVKKSRTIRWLGHVARIGHIRNEYNKLVGKPERKRPFGRPRRRWEDNIRMGLRDIGWEVADWMYLARDRKEWKVL
jgi:hypothetical protein